MKYISLAAVGIAAVAASVPATAATLVTYPTGSNIVLVPSPDGTSFSSPFSARVTGTGGSEAESSFTSAFTFTIPDDGVVSIAAISIMTAANSNINFTSGVLDGYGAFDITNGDTDIAQLSRRSIPGPGTYTFRLNGWLNPVKMDGGTASFGGDLSFSLAPAAVVPEPATWALFILGFGLIGAGLRRRSGTFRVRKAKLNFV